MGSAVTDSVNLKLKILREKIPEFKKQNLEKTKLGFAAYSIYTVLDIISNLQRTVYRRMYVSYMQILYHLYKELEHLLILVPLSNQNSANTEAQLLLSLLTILFSPFNSQIMLTVIFLKDYSKCGYIVYSVEGKLSETKGQQI